MNFSKLAFVFIALCAPLVASSQWTSISLEKFRSDYTKISNVIDMNESVSYESSTYFFETHSSVDTNSSTSSKYIFNKKKNTLFFNQFENVVVQDEKNQIICDTIEKTITLQDANINYTSQKPQLDFDLLYEADCSFEIQIKNNLTGYKLIYPEGFQYHSIEIWVNKDLYLNKFVIYSGFEIDDDFDWSNPKTIQPRMEVLFFNYQIGKAVEKMTIPSVSDYILNIDNKILAPEYKDFELIDLRWFKAE